MVVGSTIQPTVLGLLFWQELVQERTISPIHNVHVLWILGRYHSWGKLKTAKLYHGYSLV